MGNACDEKRIQVEQLSAILKSLTDTYRLLVGAAEEFNSIALASKDNVEDAIDRADELGEIIDDVIGVLRSKVRDYTKCIDS